MLVSVFIHIYMSTAHKNKKAVEWEGKQKLYLREGSKIDDIKAERGVQ